MKMLVGVLVLLFAVAVTPAQATEWRYSPFGLQVDIGAGMKWSHVEQGPLEFQQHPWVAGGLTKDLGSRFSLSATFERLAVQEALYEVRAGVWYRVGGGN